MPLFLKSFLLLFCGVLMLQAAQILPWENGGFEDAFQGWHNDNGMSQTLYEAAHSGMWGLRVTDNDTQNGSSLTSQKFSVTPGVVYCLRYWARNLSNGREILVYHRYYDADGKYLHPASGGQEEFLPLSTESGWLPYTFCTRAPENASVLRIWIHSLDRSQATADFDDFQMMALTPEEEMTTTTTRFDKRAFPALDIRHIREISEMLPATPQGIGAPATDRAAWAEILSREQFVRGVISQGEKYLTAEIPETSDELYMEFRKNGNRSHYEDRYFRKRNMLNTLALAECLEFQGRFLPKLTEVIYSILNERSWVLPAHDSALTNFHGTALYADLFCSTTAADLAQIDWMLQECLPEEIRRGIRQEVMRRALNYYRWVIRNGVCYHGTSWMTGINNWNAVCTRNMVVASQILLTDPMERAEIIAAAEVSSKFYAEGFTSDGYCSEGVGYWNYGFGYFMQMNEFLLMETKGRLNLLEQIPSLTAVCEFAKNIMLDDKMIPWFADCGQEAPAPATLELIQRHLPHTLSHRIPPQLPKSSVVAFALHAFGKPMADASFLPEKATLEPRTYFQEAGVLLCRQDAPGIGTFCAAFKGGHNGELHNHNDVGSYVISLRGIPLVLDPGSESYTRRTFSAQRYESPVLSSYGHDVPLVAGKLQSTGKSHKAVVLAANLSDEQDEFLLDMTSCYDVPELRRLTRRFLFDRTALTITVTDEVDFATPQVFETAIITKSDCAIQDETHLLLQEKQCALQAEIQTDGGAAQLQTETIPNPGRFSPTRIRIALPAPVRHGRIIVKYAPWEK